jgi:hypothetical protein
MAPNALAYAMLLIWPVVSLAIFRRLGPSRGLIACLLAGYLLLPPGQAMFDLPVLPPLNKDNIPALSALVICLVWYCSPKDLLPKSLLGRLLLATYFLSPFLTILTNTDPLFWGSFFVPGMRVQDYVSTTVGFTAQVAPFLLARALVTGDQGQRDLLWAMVLATFAYSFPMLLEVRLSPQLNTWIYGFFQHSFDQMMRGGGFRPIVFLYHGLWVAFLTSTAVLSAVTLFRSGGQRAGAALLAAAWLMMVLILCKSMASLVYTLAGLLVILAFSVRMQVRLSAFLACLLLTYPNLREADLIPVETMVELAARVNPERSLSLDYRFDNESVLLDRAQERPVFGWGSWGRNHVLQADTGQYITVSDGLWIIVLGSAGWVGYWAQIGLLVLPFVLIWWKGGPAPPRTVAGGMVIVAINLVDLIPNATLTPLTWLYAGALLGWVEHPASVAAPGPSRVPGLPVLLGSRSDAPIRPVL